MAPESITDPERVGPPSDLYSLGVVAYFLLTGRRLFEGKTALDVCTQHVTKPPVAPSELGIDIPPALEAIVLSCLAKRPGERPPSARELAARLRTVPASGGWDEATALAWWTEFRATGKPRAALPTSATITIDVGLRSSITLQPSPQLLS
jgi:serine/threonine-protein kinase